MDHEERCEIEMSNARGARREERIEHHLELEARSTNVECGN
jgi:hypothetical protein